MRLLLVLVVLPLWAADDANAILRRYMEADKLNDKKAERYTFMEDRVWFGRDKNRELKQNRSETRELIFIEGLEYSKLVSHNGQPLNANPHFSQPTPRRLWRTRSCVPRRHSWRRLLPAWCHQRKTCRDESRHGKHECSRHSGQQAVRKAG